MASEGPQRTWAVIAAESMDNKTSGLGFLHKAVDASRTIAANAIEAIGILKQTGQNAEHVTIGLDGIMKYTASAAVSAGDRLTVTTSGYFKTATSGDNVIGKNLQASVSSGCVGTGMFDFANAYPFDVASAHNSTYDFFNFAAKSDLSAAGAVGKAISIDDGIISSDSNVADGVLITGTTSGGTSVARAVGIVPVRAGDVVTKQRSITVNATGFFVDADSGSRVYGRALVASAAGNSGSTFNAMINFATPHYATSCLDISYGG